MTNEQRDRIVRWLRECQALLAEPAEVPELEALIAVVAAQASPPTPEQPTCANCGADVSLVHSCLRLEHTCICNPVKNEYCGLHYPTSPPTPTPEPEKS